MKEIFESLFEVRQGLKFCLLAVEVCVNVEPGTHSISTKLIQKQEALSPVMAGHVGKVRATYHFPFWRPNSFEYLIHAPSLA